MVKNLPAMWETTPVFLPEEFPSTEEPGGLHSMGSQRVKVVLPGGRGVL